MTEPGTSITRKRYAEQLLKHLGDSFLPRLAAGDRELLDWFQEHGCKVADIGGRLSVTFELHLLFGALSVSAHAAGAEPPSPPDWTKEFEEFCNQLMQPWPISVFEAAGLGIRRVHKSNSRARSRYEIFSITPSKEAL